MTVLSIEEFNQQSSSVANSNKKIYQGKKIAPGPIFSLANLNPAVKYCQKFTQEQDGAVCIIVREKSFLQIWSEILADRQQTSIKQQNISSKNSSPEKTRKIIGFFAPIDTDFVKLCQTFLTEYIGPVAPIVCKKTLAKKPSLTHEQFVDILAKKISNPQQAEEFRSKIWKLRRSH